MQVLQVSVTNFSGLLQVPVGQLVKKNTSLTSHVNAHDDIFMSSSSAILHRLQNTESCYPVDSQILHTTRPMVCLGN